MAQIWSTGPAHIFVGVKQVRTPAPKAPRQRSMSEGFGGSSGGSSGGGGRGGGLLDWAARIRAVLAPGDNPFNMQMVQSPNESGQVAGVIVPFDIPRRGLPNAPKIPQENPKFKTPTKPPTQLPQAPPTTRRVPMYLGTAEKAPIIEISEESEPWFTDEGGQRIPTDELYAGQTGTVTALVTRFSQAALDRIHSRPNPVTGIAGRNTIRDFGELLGLERGGFPVYIVFPNFGMESYTQTGEVMPGGYRFWFAKLVSSQIVPGTQAQKAAIRFECRQAWQVSVHSRPEDHAPVEKGALHAVLFDYDVTEARSVGVS